MIRIYDLAKEIGKKLDMDVKSSELAREIRERAEFASIRDTVKSHASTVSDEVAARMTKIYEDRQSGGKGAGEKPATPKPAGAPPQASGPAASAPAASAAPRPSAPRPPAATPPPPRPQMGGAPGAGPGARPQAPQAPRPAAAAPPRPMGGPPPRPGVPPPVAARPRLAPPPGPRGPNAPVGPPRPAGPAPTASRPAPPAAAAPGAPAQPKHAAPAVAPPVSVQPQAQQQPRAASTPTPSQAYSQPRPGGDGRGPRPGGGPSQGRPGGFGDRDRGFERERRPEPPRGRQGDQRGGRDRDDRRGGPHGAPGGQSSRPSSTPKPPPLPPTGRRPGDGQPAPPPLPNFTGDSPFVRRPAPRPAPSGHGPGRPGDHRPHDRGGDRGDRGGERMGDRPGGPPRRDDRPRPEGDRGPGRGPGAGAPPRGPRGGGRDTERPGAPLVIPDLESMTLKEGSRRGRGPGKPGDAKGGPGAAPKKKGLKTIVREEIEVRPTKVYGLADEFRRPIAAKRAKPAAQRGGAVQSRQVRREVPVKPQGPITIGSTLTVGEFAERIKVPINEIVKKLLIMGKPLTINQLIDPDLCEIVAQEFGVQLNVETESDENDVDSYRPQENAENLASRPPVVTIMGHVDHGKTTLLDAYRQSQVVQGEFGGITQHIGAYHVQTPRGVVIFLDTPGHEAFTNMRARGAKVTDIVVLVVSADDGVMPQTVEAINHAREAGVPIIVAINKIDLPQADPQRVRTELMQHSIMDEKFGGEHIFVEISAKKRMNLDQLLELILLQAEVLELKADPTCPAEGTIIESHVDPLRGAVATVLIKKGTMRVGDIFVVGTVSGRVRVMIDDIGKQVKEAGPGRPVEVIGLSGTPEVGELFVVMSEERIAREIASRRVDRRRMKELGTTRHVSLEGLHELVAEGKLKDLKLILKADVQGSIEAIMGSLTKLNNDQVKVRFLHTGTGGVTESDVSLAAASDAIIIGFNVRPDPQAAALAQQEGIEIKTYRVIYELIEEIQKAILGMLDKQYKEVTLGRVEIRQIFRNSKYGNIAGCMVLDGEITRQSKVRLLRNNVVVFDGKMGTLRRGKEDAQKVASGFECGLTLENFNDIKEGDIIEPYKMEEVALEIVAAAAGAKT